MRDACKTILECLGEDVGREGLRKTPARMAKALLEVTAGYGSDPGAMLRSALFNVESENLVVVRDIEFSSLCEHHVLPFRGKVHIGYLPTGRVVGLSKLARVVDAYGRRLQVQERLTQQVAHAIEDHVGARGVAVVVEAEHMCMSMRGAQKPGSLTVTSCFLGEMRDDAEARAEFHAALQVGSRR